MAKEITFEQLPEAVAFIVGELTEIKRMIEYQNPKPPEKRVPIEIDDACHLVKKARSTIYALVSRGELPAYKRGKRLYFYEDELINWIEEGKKKTIQDIRSEMELTMANPKRKRL